MYKYLFFNGEDKSILKFLAGIMLLNKQSEDITIQKTILDDIKIQFFGINIMQSKKVPIGEVWFSNDLEMLHKDGVAYDKRKDK